ncbi:MAG TPA: DUF6702 family protein [Cyclobacteriaceae bacterium]|nr:DUF6702 family protein [Cyclobacteriaceae bacterium]
MKMMIVFALLFQVQAVHPLHVSVTEIEYDEKEKELEIMMRIFFDDLENAIRVSRKTADLDLLAPPQELKTEKIIGEYLAGRLAVNLDGRQHPVHYLGQEVEGEAMICYLLVSNVKKWKTIEITNSTLQELHDDQSNIVHVIVGEKTKSMRLVKDKPSGSVSFEE